MNYDPPPIVEEAGGQVIVPVTTGLSLDRDGSNHFLDVFLAARNAIDELVNYLVAERRYTENQAYVLAPAQFGRHSEKRVTYGNALVVDGL